MSGITRRVLLACAAALAAGSVQAQAPNYPTHTIRIILPGAGGGTLDAVARLLADSLSAQLKQPVIVEGKPGAGGAIAADLVAKSKPDGHTLLMGTTALNALPLMQKNLPYQQRDLQPVAISLLTPMVLFAGPNLEASSVQDLIAYAKANPGKLSAGSAEATTLLTSLLFQHAVGIEVLQLRQRGVQQMIPDIAGGHVDFAFNGPTALIPLARAGRLKLLGVASANRLPVLPDVPTLAEQGVRGVVIEPWSGLMVPRGTDPAIVRLLEKTVEATVRSETFIKKVNEIGSTPRFLGTQAAAEYIANEAKALEKVAAQAGIKPD